jgi:hypothetical protein
VTFYLWEQVFKGWDKFQEKLGFKIDTENLKDSEWLWSPYDFSKYKELLAEKFDIKELKGKKGWRLNLLTIMTSSVTWSNTVYTKWFGMLLARMYIGNWGEEVVQNFLTKGEVGSLLNYLFSYKYKWNPHDTESYIVSLDPSLDHLKALENFRLTTFNATSLCLTYLLSSASILKKVRKIRLLSSNRRYKWYLKNYIRCNLKVIYNFSLGLSGQKVPISKHKGRLKLKLEWFDVWLGEQGGYDQNNRLPKMFNPKITRFDKSAILNYRKRYWILNSSFPDKRYSKNIDVFAIRVAQKLPNMTNSMLCKPRALRIFLEIFIWGSDDSMNKVKDPIP